MPTVTSKGISLYYEVSGNGSPIVLTHSFLCDGSMFSPLVAALEHSHRVINIDMRGHGRSEASETPFTIYDLVDDVLAVLDAEGVDSAVWMGHSIGGFISLRAALTRPDRVRALVLMNSDAGPETAWKKMKYAVMKQAFLTVGPRLIVPALMPIMLGKTTNRSRPEIRSEYRKKFLSMRVRSMAPGVDAITSRDSLLDRLGRIQVPTLVIGSDEDKALPLRQSKRIADGIPGAELVVVPQAGHLAPIENPGPVKDAVTRFMTKMAGF